ncbi:MAG: hypothetical protein AB1714_09855 [Acidobacteriota bacterium]
MNADASLEYVNRKGQRYYLCETKTRTGKPRYVFSREIVDRPVPSVPAGYEIYESANGVVSLRRAGSCQIREKEVAAVRSVLARYPELAGCRVDSRKCEIVIYEPPNLGFDHDWLPALLPAGDSALRLIARNVHMSPVLRFILDDKQGRTFRVQRWCYRGSIDGWLTIAGRGPIDELANRYVRHIGRDSFFDLM